MLQHSPPSRIPRFPSASIPLQSIPRPGCSYHGASLEIDLALTTTNWPPLPPSPSPPRSLAHIALAFHLAIHRVVCPVLLSPGSRLTAHGSRLMAMANGSWLMAPGSCSCSCSAPAPAPDPAPAPAPAHALVSHINCRQGLGSLEQACSCPSSL